MDIPAFLGGLFILQAFSTYFLLRNEKEAVEPALVEVKVASQKV